MSWAAILTRWPQDRGQGGHHPLAIVNALRKLESAGVVEARSLGMKGTYIRVLNEYLMEELEGWYHASPLISDRIRQRNRPAPYSSSIFFSAIFLRVCARTSGAYRQRATMTASITVSSHR